MKRPTRPVQRSVKRPRLDQSGGVGESARRRTMAVSTADRILVTGGAGFLGSFVCDVLRAKGYSNLFVPRRRDFDLTSEEDVERLYKQERPDVVLHLAAEVGGIGANRANPGRFFFAN